MRVVCVLMKLQTNTSCYILIGFSVSSYRLLYILMFKVRIDVLVVLACIGCAEDYKLLNSPL